MQQVYTARVVSPGDAPGDHDAIDQVLAAALRGDDGAVAAVLARELPRLRAFVRLNCGQLVRQHESCSDLVQSVCREALAGIGGIEFRGQIAFRNWLCCVALNKIRQRERFWLAERRTPRREESPSHADASLLESYAPLASPSQQAIAREEAERLELAFDRLPEDYRRVILLSRVVGLSHAEIAREMDRNEGAVRVLLSRALVRLTSLMERGTT